METASCTLLPGLWPRLHLCDDCWRGLGWHNLNLDLQEFQKPQQGGGFFSKDRLRTASLSPPCVPWRPPEVWAWGFGADLPQHSSYLYDAAGLSSLPCLGSLPHMVRTGLRTRIGTLSAAADLWGKQRLCVCRAGMVLLHGPRASTVPGSRAT